MNKPTPTRHGAWRVIDGQLVDESEHARAFLRAAATPAVELAEARAAIDADIGGDSAPDPDTRAATEPDTVGPAESHTPRRRRFKAPSISD